MPALVVLTVLTWRHVGAYADVEALWRDTLAKNPRSVLAAQNLGTIEFGRGRLDAATALYAIAAEPGFADALNGVGLVHARRGGTAEATASFEAALRSDPRHAEAARNLGSALGAPGRRDEANEETIRLSPRSVDAQAALAAARAASGDFAAAIVAAGQARALAAGEHRAGTVAELERRMESHREGRVPTP